MMRKQEPRYKKGDRIGGRYLVHQALMGGMGEVYLCLDEQGMMPFALKTFQDRGPQLRAIFEEEVTNWIALEKHPNIVRCYVMQSIDNIPFMMLEWIACEENRGTDLRSWLRRGPLDLALALRFTIDIVRGLQHAGDKVPGIVHRDLKPDNVLVNQSRQAKITDFGLALVAQQARLDLESETNDGDDLGQSQYVGNIVGTPPYMSPEQWHGELELDFRTDMYAVGCILYELLTGQRLYMARTISKLRTQHLEAPIPSLDGDFPPKMKYILDGCLAKDRANRFKQLDFLLDELRQLYEVHSDEPLLVMTAETFTPIDYTNRGATFRDLGQYERAIADFDQAIALNPTDAIAYIGHGACYNDLEQHERAIADFDQAIALGPPLAQAYYNRGTSYVALGQHEQAIADFDQAIVLDPTLPQSYYNRGNRYVALGQHERAIADFDQAIALDPTLIQAYMNRGNRYAALGQYERAIADYDQAIALDPIDATAWFNKGVQLANSGHLQDSLPCFEKADVLGFQQATGAIQQVKQALSTQTSKNDFQAAFNAFQHTTSLEIMHQTVKQYPVLTQMVPTIEKIIEQQVPAELKNDFSIRLLWLKQTTQDEQLLENEMNQAMREIIENYKQYGETGFRQILQQQNFSNIEIDKIITNIKQTIHETAFMDNQQKITVAANSKHETEYKDKNHNEALQQAKVRLAELDKVLAQNPNMAKALFDKGVIFAETGYFYDACSCFEQSEELGYTSFLMSKVHLNRKMAELRKLERKYPSEINHKHREQQEAFNILTAIYQKYDEAGLREALDENSFRSELIEIIIDQVKQITPAWPNDPLEVFVHVNSLDEMQKAVQQYPLLKAMRTIIKNLIDTRANDSEKPNLEMRLAWLEEIISRKNKPFWQRLFGK